MALDYVIRYDGRRVHGVSPGDSIAGGVCDMEAGSIGSLTFELPPTHPMARPGAFALEDASREVTLHDGETEIFRGWVRKTTLDTDLTLTVECESMLAYLKRTVVRPYSCRPATDLPDGTVLISQDPLEWLVAQHNLHAGESMQFEVGVNPHVGEVRAGTDYKNTWDEMNDAFCTGLDRYLSARTGPDGRRYLDLMDGGSGEGTQFVVLGENVVDMEVAGESDEVVTAIIARGTTEDAAAQAAGDRIDHRGFGLESVSDSEIPLDNSLLVIDGDRAYNQTLVDAYGIREEKREYEASNTAELLRMVSADLNPSNVAEGGVVNAVTVTAVDLHSLNPRVQPMRLLEWTRVFVRAYGLEDEDAEYGVTSGGRLVIDQWLPCSQIHIDLSDPSRSTYRFGDLPQTLTRQSALRMGMLRRGNGTLVRRTDGTEWNNDRVWNRTDDVWDHADEVGDELRDELSDAADQWSQHLDEEFDAHTKAWYESLDEAQKENAQGREDLLKHLDEVEGKWSDELGRLDGELGDLSGTVDRNHRDLLDGIRDAANGAHRTFFGICRTQSGVTSKSVLSGDLTRPGGEDFYLDKGSVVDVLFNYGEAASGLTLDIAGTGPKTIRTNGDSYGVWGDGAVLTFVYDGTYWQNCSNDVYARTVTVGKPNLANFYTNGNVAELRIGSESYWHAGVDGNRVGLLSQNHVDIGSSHVDIVRRAGSSYVRFGYDTSGRHPVIESPEGVSIQIENGSSSHVLVSRGSTIVNGSILHLTGNEIYLGDGTRPVIQCSIVVNPNGHSYADVSPTSLGVGAVAGAQGYAWVVTNGDLRAANVAVTGTSYNPDTKGITVHFAQAHSGQVRLNLWGFYCSTQWSDPGGEGPEAFGDPNGGDEGEVA